MYLSQRPVYTREVYPGALLKTIEHTIGNPLTATIWSTALVIACERSHYSTRQWVDEKTGDRSHVWPMPVAWRALILLEDQLFDWILDDDDKGRSWMILS